jgi:hypothetical protein
MTEDLPRWIEVLDRLIAAVDAAPAGGEVPRQPLPPLCSPPEAKEETIKNYSVNSTAPKPGSQQRGGRSIR